MMSRRRPLASTPGDMERATRSSRRVASLAHHLSPPSPSSSSSASLVRSPTAAASPSSNDAIATSSNDEDEDPDGVLARASPSSWAISTGGVVVSPEVAEALADGRAVVALESTIVSHGMPYPENLAMAREVEAIVRARGATPATIAIVEGVPRVGLPDADLAKLAELGPRAAKVSRRDIAACVAAKATGATTVSATMLFASRVGVSVFVTGGIGGVHRGGENSMDVSSDLTEIGRTPVAVICAGAKSVLDIPKTLEVLETHGAAVVGYGSDDFPAFFTRNSGCRAPTRVDTPAEAAALILGGKRLGLGGTVFGVPIPEEDEAKGGKVEAAIGKALREAEAKNVRGRDVTPFLLRRVLSYTGPHTIALAW